MTKVEASNELYRMMDTDTNTLSDTDYIAHLLMRANLRAYIASKRSVCLVMDCTEGTAKHVRDVTVSDMRNYNIRY